MVAPYKVTRQDIADMFNNPGFVTGSGGGVDSGSIWLVDDPTNEGHGTVLRIDQFKDEWGFGQSDILSDPLPMGIHTDIHWNNGQGHTSEDFEEVYCSFDVLFPIGYIFSKGVHTWRIKNTYITDQSAIPGRNVVNKFVLFEVNMLNPVGVIPFYIPHNGDHALANYYYNAEKAQRHIFWSDSPDVHPSGTDDVSVIYTQATLGKWMRCETHAKLNTFIGSTDQHDGVLETWVNGQQVVNYQDFPWRNVDFKDYPFNQCTFEIWLGGGDATYSAPQDQSIYFDNFIISTSPITHT